MPTASIVLAPDSVHLWRTALTLTSAEEADYLALLSADEVARARRFHFPLHQQRFIAARATLRLILGQYLGIAPQAIQFLYSKRGKPYLADVNLQFNLSHSADAAVYALTLDQAIGVDIEKIATEFKAALAERYFSPQENTHLLALPEDARGRGFYHIWARKEALLKGSGEGLHIPLTSFSVSLADVETLPFQEAVWHLQSFSAFPDYASAFATTQSVKNLSFYAFTAGNFHLINTGISLR